MSQPMFNFDVRGLVGAQQQLQLLALSAAQRRRLLNTAAKRLRTSNRQRIRAQRNLDGTAYAPRNGGSKRKLLSGLGKNLQVVSVSSESAVLGWKSRVTSRIADEHQAGKTETMTPARLRRQNKAPDYAAPATREQAKGLLKAGYQVRSGKNGKRRKRPALGWIVEHLKSGQAGLILAQLQGKTPKRHSWNVVLPARAVLGASAQDVRQVLSTVLQQTLNAPR
ncbi:phage virion morphogenesis protein [Pseudomonas sp. CCI4.2]|uniref:phage virion morphogenesis protein n=1 Tax=Pseudomonas sp. CCI4.2 TaxID=3048620 RepID=UPI002AC94D94|nr:phage virion morphogenesis protein [Pseudomonas sp. CCI4.2]MEB0090064.1 phage virion morphogenesis protein [Pseudomonas sp. CCI4.2]WPX53472.1 phage virion morphogenesis protein [Pseudomonas sp. CCI4.2]